MERHFALPVAFAAALHGALLFGFNKSPRAATVKVSETTIREIPFLPLPPDEPEIILATAGEARSPAPPDRPIPVASPEPVAVNFESPFVMKPPVVEFTGDSDLRKFVEIPTNIRSGDGEDPFGVGSIMSSIALDNVPRARLQAAPIYPHEAKTTGTSGEVHVEFIVDGSGSVVEARAVHASSRMFEEAAVRAVLKWKFEPGRKNGRIVSFRMVVPVVFNLNE